MSAGLIITHQHGELAARPGEMVLVSGESGSGKTLFLNRLAGIESLPEKTSITLAGAPLHEDTSLSLRMYFDIYPPLWLGRLTRDELLFGLSDIEEPDIQQALKHWRLNDLPLDTPTERLNRLQHLRLMLAAVQLAEIQLVLLDNPTSSLSTQEQSEFLSDLQDWSMHSNAIVIIACARHEEWLPTVQHHWHIETAQAWPSIHGATHE